MIKNIKSILVDLAQYNLGVCYEDDILVKKDLKQAAYYYDLATKQGREDAQEALARIRNCASQK